jgi:hypothetical protein
VFRDHDFLSIFRGLEQLAQAVFCLEGADGFHAGDLNNLAASSLNGSLQPRKRSRAGSIGFPK